MDQFKKKIEKMGEGLYVVGLDKHVGYLFYENNKMTFIHSRPTVLGGSVKSENANESKYLVKSIIKFAGRLFNDEMVENWILNKNLEK